MCKSVKFDDLMALNCLGLEYRGCNVPTYLVIFL